MIAQTWFFGVSEFVKDEHFENIQIQEMLLYDRGTVVWLTLVILLGGKCLCLSQAE